MRVLHIASFNGNIGDNASHNGFRTRFEQIINIEISYTKVEMREFYKSWNLRSFNSVNFIDLCNQHDLVVIGGGNFFELKWDYSSTGTTIDMKIETLDKINTPIFFNGIGCDIGKGASKKNVEKFKRFLDNLLDRDNCMVSFREDGSKRTIEKLYGKSVVNQLSFIPDNAFFMENSLYSSHDRIVKGKTIGINIVSDMINVRFGSQEKYLVFLKKLSDVLEKFLVNNREYRLVFFPHIFSDLNAINLLLESLSDDLRRTKISVAPYLTGSGSDHFIFNMYKSCDLIMGMRFHSNICSICQNIPTIALSSYPKIDYLYDILDLDDRIVNTKDKNFSDVLSLKLTTSIQELSSIKSRFKKINDKLLNQRLEFEINFKDWLKNNNLILGE